MAFNHYAEQVVADVATGRPLANQPVKLLDFETNAPVDAYIDGTLTILASGANGLVPPFQTLDTTRRVKLIIGNVAYSRWCDEMIEKGASSYVDVEILKSSNASISAALTTKSDKAPVDALNTRVSAIETLGGLAPGDVSDATMAGVLSNATSLSRNALGGVFVRRGEWVFDVRDYGAKGNGVADDTAAINAASNAAYAANQDAAVYIPAGVYKITGTVFFRTSLDASNAELRYFGTGVAVQIGSGTSGENVSRKTIRLPRVRQYTNGYNPTSHDGTSVGVKAINLISCDLYVPFIQHFEDGLVMHGLGAGNGYNTVYLQSLWGNHRGLVISRDTNGWSNQNLYLGGRISPASWYSGDAAGSYISINGNQNTFINTSVEGGGDYLHRVKFLAARYNTFISPRFEATAWNGKPGILWGTGSYYNRIEGGYNLVNTEETFESETGGNTLWVAEGPTDIRCSQVGALSIPPSTATAINTWTGHNGFRYTYDSATGVFTPRQGRWQINATVGLSFTTGGGYAEVKIIRSDGTMLAVRRFIPQVNVLTNVEISARETFTEGRGFKIEVYHTNSAAVAISTSGNYCKLQAEYLGY